MATLSRTPRSAALDRTVAIDLTGIDLTATRGAPCDTLRAAIAQHGGAIDWTVDHTGWVVTLYLPEERVFCGGTLEDGLLSCLAWLVAAEQRDTLARG